jgi:hypothetical protein
VIGTFQRGLQLAQCPIVFLCDQDDVWLPGKRTAYVAAFEGDPKVSVVISDAEMIDGHGQLIEESYMTFRGGFNPSVPGTLLRNRYLGCAMALRSTLLKVALPMPVHVPMHDMWLGALGRLFGRVIYMSRPYQRHRRHGGNASPLGSGSWRRMLSWRLVLAVELSRRALAVSLGLHKSTTSARVAE